MPYFDLLGNPMAQITLAHSFIDALARLDPINAKRTAAFLDKLIEEPEASGLHTEMVHGANDRTVRSMRVTVDLRAIARQLGDQLLLLFVGHHDDAYSWARAHCSGCESTPSQHSVKVLSGARSQVQPAYAHSGFSARSGSDWPASSPDASCTIDNGRELCRVLDAANIDHGLAH